MIKRHQKAEARRQTKQKRRKKLVYSSSCLPSITFFLSSTTPSSSHTFRTSARRELFENEKSRKILIHHRGVNLFLYAVVARREKLFSLFCRADSSRLATLSEENRQSYLNNADAITSLWKTSDRKLSKKNIFLIHISSSSTPLTRFGWVGATRPPPPAHRQSRALKSLFHTINNVETWHKASEEKKNVKNTTRQEAKKHIVHEFGFSALRDWLGVCVCSRMKPEKNGKKKIKILFTPKTVPRTRVSE